MINTSRLYGSVASDVFEACFSEQLARSGNMLYAHEAIVIHGVVLKRGTYEPESCILCKLSEQKFEIAFPERYIAVHAADHVVAQRLNFFEAGIERKHLPSKVPLLAFWGTDELKP